MLGFGAIGEFALGEYSPRRRDRLIIALGESASVFAVAHVEAQAIIALGEAAEITAEAEEVDQLLVAMATGDLHIGIGVSDEIEGTFADVARQFSVSPLIGRPVDVRLQARSERVPDRSRTSIVTAEVRVIIVPPEPRRPF